MQVLWSTVCRYMHLHPVANLGMSLWIGAQAPLFIIPRKKQPKMHKKTWQGWMGVESIDGEHLAICSHAATMTTVYCTVDIKPGINEPCMFHSLQFSTTTCRYNREQKPMIAMYILFGGLFCSSSHLPHWQVSQTRERQDTPARLCPTEKFPTFRAVPLIYGT